MWVFGGYRQRNCGEPLPCGEPMNELLALRLMPDERPRWELPAVAGMPPTPRRGHTMTPLPQYGEQGGLLVFGGLGWSWNSSLQAAEGFYLNDAHIFDVANSSWYAISPQGSPPGPRASHTATLTADGSRVVIHGGLDAGQVLNDLHVLDTRHMIWWQLYTTGRAPSARHSHVAVLVGTNILFFGGIPAERSDHGSTHLLHTGEWELRTSALLERVLVEEPTLNATCGLYSGSVGSSAQIWRCGVVK